MTRATVEDSTARLGHTLHAGRPLVGGLSLNDVPGTVHGVLQHVGCQEELKLRS